ncbi:MAG: hypothetical protein ACXACA_07605, partial [Candidatus Ranarchaeia archaeon]
GFYEPYLKLAEIGGKYLGIGLGYDLVALRHEAQRLAGLFNIVSMFYGVKYRDQEKIKTFVYNRPPCARNLTVLIPNLIKKCNVRIGKIGMANSILGSSKEFLDEMTIMLKEDLTLTLCNKIYCLWCREAEKRLHLYDEIKNPKYFQKNLILRGALTLINSLRLRSLQEGDTLLTNICRIITNKAEKILIL